MSTPRENLAAHLYRQSVRATGEPQTAWEHIDQGVWLRAADEAMAAMGVPSAVVTTVEELNALPWDAVVLDSRRIAHQHIESHDFGPLHWWNPYNEIRDWVMLPATVLHRGCEAAS